MCDDGDNALQHRNDRMDVNTATVTVDDDDSNDKYTVTSSHEVQELMQSNASNYDSIVCKKKCDTNMSKDSETVLSVSCSSHDNKTRETAMDKAADRNDVCKDVDNARQSNTEKMDVNIPSSVIGSEKIDQNNMANSTHNDQQSSESGDDDKEAQLVSGSGKASSTPTLSECGTDLTEAAVQGELDEASGKILNDKAVLMDYMRVVTEGKVSTVERAGLDTKRKVVNALQLDAERERAREQQCCGTSSIC